MKRQAVFLDRDGTIIEDTGYVDDPAKVRLLAGSAGAIRRLSEGGFLVVVTSNQSGVARGLFDEATMSAVHDRMEKLLRGDGAVLDGAYYCPFLAGREAVVETFRRDSDLRKPKPGLLLQAANELDIDLRRSWMVGDSPRDVEAGRRAGCRTVLIDPNEKHIDDRKVRATRRAGGLVEASELILSEKSQPQVPSRERTSSDDVPALVSVPAPDDVPAPGNVPAPGEDDDVARMLGRIREELATDLPRIERQLDRVFRRQRQDDFSVLRLFGALLQMFAIAAAIWGGMALLGDQPAMGTPRFLLACFLQLSSISIFAIDRFR